ncbi:hypothetical protein LEP1GSC060_0392 [Leptospira weilii serovar Ranarum str. ICFT]|uniref:Uncharacterized protein n=1 Tax=Leptospira weilii serovar Ranarum str. ICFT TaxID=1218598 RepID=N1WL96_9LEPT|nr:hypothetical protein LEP1GSC060_0392 [Leptospira weilii serovar Ranarum str. ICFT]
MCFQTDRFAYPIFTERCMESVSNKFFFRFYIATTDLIFFIVELILLLFERFSSFPFDSKGITYISRSTNGLYVG